LLNAVWLPIPVLTGEAKSGSVYTQTFDLRQTNAAACFYKIMFTNVP
jgi:hypothetical protein